MKILFQGVLLMVFITFSCSKNAYFTLKINENQTDADSIFVKSLITEKLLGIYSTNDRLIEVPIEGSHPSVVSINLKSRPEYVLSIVSDRSHKDISILSNSIQVNGSVLDSLMNYINHSTNKMFSKYSGLLFRDNNPNEVRNVFDSLLTSRQKAIDSQRRKMSASEYELISYQNKARIYSFLFFYGRMVKKYHENSNFYSFTNNIKAGGTYIESLPDIVLYKFENEILRKDGKIHSIDSFLNYIEENAVDGYQDYLKSTYLRKIIESPSYWPMHQQLITNTNVEKALNREKNNPYYNLIEFTAKSYYSSRSGETAFDFVGSTINGEPVKLSDFYGKVVLIDTWATWCGPCIGHRPTMLEIAKKYDDHNAVQVILLSVDSNEDKWKEYVTTTNPQGAGLEIIIPDGMSREFGDKYLVKSIPRYILIDKRGKIISSEITEPSIRMEQMVEHEILNN